MPVQGKVEAGLLDKTLHDTDVVFLRLEENAGLPRHYCAVLMPALLIAKLGHLQNDPGSCQPVTEDLQIGDALFKTLYRALQLALHPGLARLGPRCLNANPLHRLLAIPPGEDRGAFAKDAASGDPLVGQRNGVRRLDLLVPIAVAFALSSANRIEKNGMMRPGDSRSFRLHQRIQLLGIAPCRLRQKVGKVPARENAHWLSIRLRQSEQQRQASPDKSAHDSSSRSSEALLPVAIISPDRITVSCFFAAPGLIPRAD